MLAPSTEPNFIQTPKSRFREVGQNVTDHRAMVETKRFQAACDFATLEYAAQLAQHVTDNPSQAAFAGLKLCGWMEGLFVMRNLSETAKVIVRTPPPNLDHKA